VAQIIPFGIFALTALNVARLDWHQLLRIQGFFQLSMLGFLCLTLLCTATILALTPLSPSGLWRAVRGPLVLTASSANLLIALPMLVSLSQHTAMASGITVTPNPDPAQLQSLGVTSWPTWGCGVSIFPWSYDEQEICLLLDGEVTVTPDGGEPVRFGAGDLVVFDAGLSCTWEVHAAVRKHYRFG
jgi:hypothetical protein